MCKDLTVSFLRVPPQELSTSLYISIHPLEKVNCYMMRGWSYRKTLNGTPTLARSPTVGLKASKRLHILRVLRNPSVITIYISLIRSILEYCWAVWSTSISLYLSDKLKKFRVVPYVFSIRICPTLLSLTYLLSLACLIAATLSA